MESILKGLNVAQKAAVTSKASILQVLAPPGSGKTKTLTSRVAYLLAHDGYAPQNVICCTFTLKASREMRARLRGLVGCDLESKLVLGTFHSICRRYLVTYGYLIGLPKNFGIADSGDTLSILKRIQKRLNLSIDPKTARSKISHRKARGKRLEDLPQTTKTIDAQEFGTIFQEYENALKVSNLLDYDDLLLRCVDLLREHPECVSNVEVLLIDEFQDTNVVQFELMKLLASRKKKITVVGDPDQSIYGFRSAEIENLQRMKEFYRDTVVINLEENYRSSSAILHLAQDVIEQDDRRPDKKLKATHCYGTLPVLRRLPNPHEEALWIVNEIKRITKMTGQLINYSDIAVLLRSAFLSLLVEKALANSGVPYRMVGGRRFFDRVEVRTLLDYLRTVSHPDNNSAFLAIINTPSRKVGDTTVAELSRLAEEKKVSIWSIVQRIIAGSLKMEKKLSHAAENGLQDLVSLVKYARQKLEDFEPSKAPGELIGLIVQKLQYQNYIKKQYREDHEERWENVQELATQAREVTFDDVPTEDELVEIEGLKQNTVHGSYEILARFLANVALSTEVETDGADDKPRITISTIHSSKGLEWPVVFVPAMYEGSIPHSRADDTDEERRLLYVAMTRAQSLLYMTFPVMQSREQSESVLTQFLPTSLHQRLAEIGCGFNDTVVNDIATLLRREPPSQDKLAKAIVSLQEGESQYDDIWPSDGSYRRCYKDINIESSMSTLQQRGQSLAGVLQSTGPMQQKRDFSSLVTFTTASYEMSRVSHHSTISNTLCGSDSIATKSGTDQGDLRKFFANGSFKTKHSSSVNLSNIGQAQLSSKAHTSTSTVPSELASHRLTTKCDTNALTGCKRPRAILEDASPNKKPNSNNRYAFLSSSPPPEETSENMLMPTVILDKVRDINTKTMDSFAYKPPSLHETTMSALGQTRTTNEPSRSSASSSCSVTSQGISYSSGMLGSLSKPSQLLPNIKNDNKSQQRHTLGMRRTMTSWADRKHK